jgi:hypothetical protein
VDFAYVTELPTMPRPRVTQYRVWACRCTGCGRKVRGGHPVLAQTSTGLPSTGWGRGLWLPLMPCTTRRCYQNPCPNVDLCPAARLHIGGIEGIHAGNIMLNKKVKGCNTKGLEGNRRPRIRRTGSNRSLIRGMVPGSIAAG